MIVATSASDLKGHKTGCWLEELAVPYTLFQKKGYQVVLASPAGGEIPLDAASLSGDFFTPVCQAFMQEEETAQRLTKSQPLSAIDFKTVDAIYLTGGHGTCVDFIQNETLKNAIETVYAAGKVVAADCHGVIALTDCTIIGGDNNKKDQTPLVKDKNVTGFANSEEDAVKLSDKVPFMLEDKLKELGAHYTKADADWGPHVVVDGKLITGQNPGSSELCAQKTVELLLK